MKKISFGRVLGAGIVFAIISMIIHSLDGIIGMKYYLMEEYFPVWSKLMMPAAGPPPASFMVYSLLFALITGILLAIVYNVVKSSLKVKGLAKKGLMYGFLVFLVGSIPGLLMTYLVINLPVALTWLWVLESLIIDLLGGMAIAGINK